MPVLTTKRRLWTLRHSGAVAFTRTLAHDTATASEPMPILQPRTGVIHKIQTRRSLARVVPLCAMLLAGCGAEKALWTPPAVAFRGVALDGVGPLGGRMRVRLLVRNANPYALTTTALRYRLLVRDTVEIARGSDAERRTVAARDSVIVDLPLDVSWKGLQAAGGALATQGAVAYRLVGDVTLDTPIGARTVSFDEQGQFAPGRSRR